MRIPENIPLNQEGQYCIKCFAKSVRRVFDNGLTHYYCDVCGKTSERSLVIDNSITWWIDGTREYWHESVGVFVFNADNKALFFERTIYPFALAIPAGHLDNGENIEDAVKRELEEETGIIVNEIKLFSEEDILRDNCRRGADNHKWHLYTAKADGREVVKINDEGRNSTWLTLEEAIKKELAYPVKYLIEKYGDQLLPG